MHLFGGSTVEHRLFRCTEPNGDDGTQRLGGIFVQWNGAFLHRIAGRNTQPRSSVRIVVEAVH